MRRIVAIAAFATLVILLAGGKPGTALAGEGKPSAAEKAIIDIENEWNRAALAGDATALGKILADDWVGYSPQGSRTRAEALGNLKSGETKVSSIQNFEMKVRFFGDTAVVTGAFDEKSSFKGKDTTGHYTFMDVFVKRKGKWQAVASQNTLVPPK